MFRVHNLDIGLSISITDDCIDTLMKNRRNQGEFERGGLLFAKPIIHNLITITRLSQPTKKDKSGKHFFKPDENYSQQEIDRQFENKLAYIGDWHTHPTTTPEPSQRDISTIKKIFRKSTHNLNYTLMIIIGTSNDFCDNYFCLTDGINIYELTC